MARKKEMLMSAIYDGMSDLDRGNYMNDRPRLLSSCLFSDEDCDNDVSLPDDPEFAKLLWAICDFLGFLLEEDD